jgi:hypothetical protein
VCPLRLSSLLSATRETRESLLTVQGLMRETGHAVSIAQLCRWFGVPRSIFLSAAAGWCAARRGRGRRPANDESDIIETDPAAGLRMIHRAGPAGEPDPHQQEESPSHPEAEPVVGPAAPAGPSPAGPGLGVAGDPAGRTVGDRYHPSLLRPRRVVSPDRAHRLL